MRVCLAAFVCVLSATAAAQELPHIAIGGHSAHLQTSAWLDGKPPADTYQGRCTLVHFFAPWSEASLRQFAQLAELQAALGDKMAFVSIANAPRAEVEAIAASHAPKSRLAIDDDGKTFFAYGVRRLPHVVLTDEKGRLVAQPRLESITVKVLEQLLEGQQIWLPSDPAEAADVDWDADAGADLLGADRTQAHCFVGPSPATSGGVRMPPGSGRIVADGLAFPNLVQLAWSATATDLLATHPDSRNFARRWRVSVRAADDKPETARAMLRERLERQFACRGQWIETTAKVTALRRQAGKDVVAATAAAPRSTAKVAIARLPDLLRTHGLADVVDETGLAGDTVVELAWPPSDRKAMTAALEAIGLCVVTEDRPVRRLQLTPVAR